MALFEPFAIPLPASVSISTLTCLIAGAYIDLVSFWSSDGASRHGSLGMRWMATVIAAMLSVLVFATEVSLILAILVLFTAHFAGSLMHDGPECLCFLWAVATGMLVGMGRCFVVFPISVVCTVIVAAMVRGRAW